MPKDRTAEEISKEINRLVAASKGLAIAMNGLSKSEEGERIALISRTERINAFYKSLQDAAFRIEQSIASLKLSLAEGTTFGIKRSDLDEFLRELVKMLEADIAVLNTDPAAPFEADVRKRISEKLGALTSRAKGFRRKISADKKV